MTILEALATLEAAVLECNKRDINTPEVKESLNLLEPYVWPKLLARQFRYEVSDGYGNNDVDRENRQQVLRATFPGIRDAVRELLGIRLEAPIRKFHVTHDMQVKEELVRLIKEYGKLREPWVFVSIEKR